MKGFWSDQILITQLKSPKAHLTFSYHKLSFIFMAFLPLRAFNVWLLESDERECDHCVKFICHSGMSYVFHEVIVGQRNGVLIRHDLTSEFLKPSKLPFFHFEEHIGTYHSNR